MIPEEVRAAHKIINTYYIDIANNTCIWLWDKRRDRTQDHNIAEFAQGHDNYRVEVWSQLVSGSPFGGYAAQAFWECEVRVLTNVLLGTIVVFFSGRKGYHVLAYNEIYREHHTNRSLILPYAYVNQYEKEL